MEIRHLDALLAITESGSFSAAAEVLHTVQSNVSEQIRQLERELGVPVLVRHRFGPPRALGFSAKIAASSP